MNQKQCNKCKELKPLNEFFKDKNHSSGYYSICKLCKQESTYKWRKANRKEYNALAVKWRDKNPDKQHATDIKRNYGISIKEYNALLALQGNKCAICPKVHNPLEKRGRLYVDHCHTSGEIRGLLCGACNSGIGYFEDDLGRLQNATDYLKHKK